jgi:hypothetical protein
VIQNNPGHPYDGSSDVLYWRIFRFEKFRKEGINMEEGVLRKT